MGKAVSVTLNVTWKPYRFLVQWADAPDEIPLWDMSRAGLPTAAYAGTFYEDVREHPEQHEAIIAAVNDPRRYRSSDHHMPSTPRLVRAWPGESRAVLPVQSFTNELTGTGKELSGPFLTDWPRVKPFHKAILGLKKYLKPDLEPQFKAEAKRLANHYALLDPIKGDTLSDWYEAVKLLWVLTEVEDRIDFFVETSSSRDELNAKELFNEALDKVHAKMKPFVPRRGLDERWMYLGDLAETPAVFRELLRLELMRGVKGENEWTTTGLGLRIGGLDWALIEFAQILGAKVSRCVICQKRLEARRGALTHKECRKIKSRANALARATGESLPYPEGKIATTVPQLEPYKGKSKPVKS